MNYYERHIGDYLKDTAHLSLLEHGVYTRLLDVYYTREGGIPAADAGRLVGARSREERAALAAVLAEFFELRDGVHVQSRADREIARFNDKREKAKRSAETRWSAMRTQCERIPDAVQETYADALRTQSEGNAPRARPQTPDTKHHNPPNASRSPPPSGHRLPPDWQPDADGMAFAEQSGLKNGRADAELARFRDYWHAQPGAKGRKADWPATWRNWCRKAAETPSRPNVGHAAEPAWRTEQRERMQAFAPGVAARRPGPTVTVIEGGDDGTVRLVG